MLGAASLYLFPLEPKGEDSTEDRTEENQVQSDTSDYDIPELPPADYSCWDQATVDQCNNLSGEECIFYSETCEPILDQGDPADATAGVSIAGCQPIDCNRATTFTKSKEVCEAAGQTWFADELDPFFGDCICSSYEGVSEQVTTCVEGVRDCEALNDAGTDQCRTQGYECFLQHGEESNPESDACYSAACAEAEAGDIAVQECLTALDESVGGECNAIISEDLHVFLFSEARCVPQAEYDSYIPQEIDWQFEQFPSNQ